MFWTRESIVEAIRHWAQQTGRAPVSADFNGAAGWSGVLPFTNRVYRHFRTLAEAREAAGLAQGQYKDPSLPPPKSRSQAQAIATQYVAEYDENSCVWLTNLVTKTRVPLAHGALLDVVALTPPRVAGKGGVQ